MKWKKCYLSVHFDKKYLEYKFKESLIINDKTWINATDDDPVSHFSKAGEDDFFNALAAHIMGGDFRMPGLSL